MSPSTDGSRLNVGWWRNHVIAGTGLNHSLQLTQESSSYCVG